MLGWLAAAVPAPAAASVTVPITLANNHIFVDVALDGRGPYHFVLDSGSPFGLLDRDVAAHLGLSVRASGTIGGVGDAALASGKTIVRSVSVGGRELTDRTFVVAPLRDVALAEGRPIDGVIGHDLFGDVVTTIDYARQTITLDDDFAAVVRGGASVLPMQQHAGLPQVACRVADVAGRCTVDTGSRLSVTVLAPFARAHPTIAPRERTAPGVDGFGLGGPSYGRLAPLATLTFGSFVVRDTIADFSLQTRGAFADPATAANVGGGIWRRFALTFDEMHGRIAMRRVEADRERFDRSGLFLVGTELEAIAVLDVRPGTPAAAAGLRVGDVLLASDGHPLVAADLPALRDALADPARSTVALHVAGDVAGGGSGARGGNRGRARGGGAGGGGGCDGSPATRARGLDWAVNSGRIADQSISISTRPGACSTVFASTSPTTSSAAYRSPSVSARDERNAMSSRRDACAVRASLE
ncbi:MAG: hypothetical protein NVS3B17_21580 [Vulcanimicrobiaceae bacterium]